MKVNSEISANSVEPGFYPKVVPSVRQEWYSKLKYFQKKTSTEIEQMAEHTREICLCRFLSVSLCSTGYF